MGNGVADGLTLYYIPFIKLREHVRSLKSKKIIKKIKAIAKKTILGTHVIIILSRA